MFHKYDSFKISDMSKIRILIYALDIYNLHKETVSFIDHENC